MSDDSPKPELTVDSLRAKAIARAEAGDGLEIFKSIRKRGYHRALKRKVPWAVWQKTTMDMINDINQILFEAKTERAEIVGINAWLYSQKESK